MHSAWIVDELAKNGLSLIIKKSISKNKSNGKKILKVEFKIVDKNKKSLKYKKIFEYEIIGLNHADVECLSNFLNKIINKGR
jgi:hypothetical protein